MIFFFLSQDDFIQLGIGVYPFRVGILQTSAVSRINKMAHARESPIIRNWYIEMTLPVVVSSVSGLHRGLWGEAGTKRIEWVNVLDHVLDYEQN